MRGYAAGRSRRPFPCLGGGRRWPQREVRALGGGGGGGGGACWAALGEAAARAGGTGRQRRCVLAALGGAGSACWPRRARGGGACWEAPLVRGGRQPCVLGGGGGACWRYWAAATVRAGHAGRGVAARGGASCRRREARGKATVGRARDGRNVGGRRAAWVGNEAWGRSADRPKRGVGPTRGTDFGMSSAGLSREARIELLNRAGLRPVFGMRWAWPRVANRATKQPKSG